jgi:hypothetical protein
MNNAVLYGRVFRVAIFFAVFALATPLCDAAPLIKETPDAAGAAQWLKNLAPIRSPDTVMDTMNAFDIHKTLDEPDWDAIHNAGMPGFYADPVLKNAILKKLKAELQQRSQIMGIAGAFFNRNVVGEGFWEMIEPEPGNIHYEITDEILFAANASGTQSLMLITPLASWDQLNGGYFFDQPFSDPRGNLFMLNSSLKALGPVVDLQAYRAFLSGMKKHTGQMYFEIGNEVDGGSWGTYKDTAGAYKYLELLRHSRQALGPNAIIVNAGAIGFKGFPPTDMDRFWRTFFAYGGADLIDALNLHYGNEIDTTAADSSELGSLLEYFNRLMKDFHVTKPIWLTEVPFGDASLSERQVAGLTLRRFAYAAFRGTRKFFIEFCEDRLPAGPPQGLNGLARSAMMFRDLNGAYVAQLMFYSQRLINYKLSGFTSCEELKSDEQYRFTVNGRSVYVLRGTGMVPTELLGQKVRITDISGHEDFPRLPPGPVPVSVIAVGSEIPVFVELD